MGSPSIPKPPPTPPPAALPIDPAVMEARRRARSKVGPGRSSTMLTGAKGLLTRGSISTPTLLGGGGTPLGTA